MKERALRKRCRKLLNDLRIAPPLDVNTLCDRIGADRGRPIELVAYPLAVPGPFGCWIATAEADYIFYQRQTTSAHQNHIILHELGHLLADHDSGGDAVPTDFGDRGELARVAPRLDPNATHRALRRTAYDEEHEREAELVATIILEWASVVDYTIAPRDGEQTLRPMQRALTDNQGWL